MDENEQLNVHSSDMNNFYNNNVKRPKAKKKGKGLLILAIIILILSAGLVGGYIYITSPAPYYKLTTSLMMKNALKNISIPEYKTAKSTLKLDVELEQEMGIIDEKIIDLVNDITLELGLQEDKEQQQFVVDVNTDYQKEELINAQMFIDSKNEKSHIYINELLDKYLEIELPNNNIYSQLVEVYEAEKVLLEKQNVQKAMNIIRKEIVNCIKTEYCSSEKATININSKDVETSCKTIKMTAKQYINSFATIADNLAKNEEFISLIKDEYKEKVKEFLKSYKEKLEVVEIEGTIKLNTYTTGILPKVVKLEVVVENTDKNKGNFVFEIVKLEEQKYSYALKTGETTVMQGTIIKNKNNIEFVIEVENLGSLQIYTEMKQEVNVQIDTININKAILAKDLTEQEQKDLIKNFQASKLYELIDKFNKEDTTDSNLDKDSQDDDVNSLFGEEKKEDNKTQSIMQNNQIKTYDNKTLITFGDLTGYKYNRTSDNYQILTKDNIYIEVTSSYGNESGYYSEMERTKEYMEKNKYYSDVTLSKQTTAQIGGKTFYKATLSYKNGSSENNLDYIWAQVSDDYCIKIVIQNINDMTTEELKQLLTITVEN